jgi:GntR family transcriptional regulator
MFFILSSATRPAHTSSEFHRDVLTISIKCISVPIHLNCAARSTSTVDITINLSDGVPIYRQIVNQVKYLVASGLLQPGEELPPIRTLALQLKVTPNTIVKAYGELEIAGVVHKRQGSGTFVSEARPQLALRERRRVIEQRIDALLTEAHQLNFTADEILRMVRERKAQMDETAAEPAEVKKEVKR